MQKQQDFSKAENRATKITELMVKRGLKFPFYLKLGLAISLLSVGVATAGTYWLYSRTQGDLLQDMSEELQAIGIKEVSTFTKEDIAAIKKLDREMAALSKPIIPAMLATKQMVALNGLQSKVVKNQLLKSKTYRTVAQKLGEITNKSRRDNSSDIFIMSTYLVATIPESPDRKFLRILADDDEYRYTDPGVKSEPWIGDYHAPVSPLLSQAFDGVAKTDNSFYTDEWGTFITAAIPIKDASGKVITVMGLDVDVRSIAKELNRLKYTYFHVVSGSLIFSLLVAFLLARWLVQPIVKLHEGAERVRNRDFGTVIDVKSNDELQLLAETFNSMVAEIGSYAHTLEKQVKERTVQLNEAKQELENDLEKGQKLQRDFLPEPLLELPNWEIAAVFEPAKKVAGDFYDVFLLPGNYVGLVIADVCDKGVGAAMFMGLFRSFIRVFSGHICLDKLSIGCHDQAQNYLVKSQIENELAQSQALEAVEITNNYIVKEHGQTGMFATMFFGILNPTTGLMTYINGGHEPLYIVNSNGIKETLIPTGPAVGMIPNVKYKSQQVQFEPGDLLIGYTDGVIDARSPNGEFFSCKRLVSLLNQPTSSASELLEQIKTDVFTHTGSAPQFDDITMLAVQWTIPKEV